MCVYMYNICICRKLRNWESLHCFAPIFLSPGSKDANPQKFFAEDCPQKHPADHL